MVEIKQKRIFNPAEESKELLIATFAIRKEAFSRIMKFVIATSPSLQHYLIIGQRGMGKTTLMLRIKYEIEDSVELSKKIIPIRFSEEQYNLSSLPDVWEEIGLFLEKSDKALTGLVDRMISLEKYDNFERLMFEEIVTVLKQKNKRILLLIDNIGDLFNKLSDLENKRLREILMTTDHIQLIGASTHMLEHTFSYDKPFFEFFSEVRLDPLTSEEAKELMLSLAQHYQTDEKIKAILNESPERIEVFRRISGGVPRTMILLFEILLDENEGGVFKDLELLLDRVGDWYKHRLDSLKPQQQKIMDAIARAWEPVSSGDVLKLSRLTREGMASNQISAQLKQMEQSQLIASMGEKRKLYFIPERFFNIWYLMRHGRQNSKEKILWLIKFIESWCINSQDLDEMIQRHIHALKRGKYEHQAAYYKTLALYEQPGLNIELKKDLMNKTYGYLTQSGSRLLAEQIMFNIVIEPGITTNMEVARKAVKSGDFHKAEKYLLEAVGNNEDNAELNLGCLYHFHLRKIDQAEYYYLIAAEKGDINATYNLAILYEEERKEIDKAEYYYLKAAEKGDVNAIFNLAVLYHEERKDIEKAELYYLKAVEKEDLSALFNLALLYQDERKDIGRAEFYYLKAVEKGDLGALFNLAMLYEDERKDIDKAESYYLRAIENGDLGALNNLALLYQVHRKDIDKAESYYLMAIENGYLSALNNLAILYHEERRDIDKAEVYYLKAIEEGDVSAMNNLALLYKKYRKDFHQAEHYYLKAIENGDVSAMKNLAIHYKEEVKDIEKAETYFLKAIENGDSGALNNLALLYQEERKDIEKAENYFLKAIENGDIGALNNLAIFYQEDKKDIDKAEFYFLKAIEMGDTNAIFNLALVYHEERREFDKAETYYIKAIENGDVIAMYNLANLYKSKNDIDKAEHYYLKAIDNGDISSMNNLAMLYQEERKDIDKAESYYLMAIEYGHIIAINNLALLYKKDKKDIEKAEFYCIKAIEEGNVDALYNLALLYHLEIKDINKAESYYLKAIEKGDENAMNSLAMLYEEERNEIENAEYYYLMAIKKGDVNAMNNLALLYEENKRDFIKAEQYFLMGIKNGSLMAYINYINLLLNQQNLLTALDFSKDLFNNEFFYSQEGFLEMGSPLVIKLLRLGQTNFLLKLFNDETSKFNLHFRPLYFVLAYFMKDELPGEYEKAGAEIKETVDEIIRSIELKK
jgi:TPR repeat protein